MTIIEVDGVNTQPLVVDSIEIYAGQRYSFILEAQNKVANYWIRAEPKSPRNGDGAPQGFNGGINSAILRYAGALPVDPTTSQTPSIEPLLETNLHPLENPGAPGKPYPGGADVSLTLNLGVNPQGDLLSVNNVSFVPPSVPVLLQILSGNTKATELLPKGSVYSLPPNKVIELAIPGHGIIGSPVSNITVITWHQNLSFTMTRLGIQATNIAAALGFVAVTQAAIGPVANLNVVNAVIAPDGFPRSLVKLFRFFLAHDPRLNFLKSSFGERTVSRPTNPRFQGNLDHGILFRIQ